MKEIKQEQQTEMITELIMDCLFQKKMTLSQTSQEVFKQFPETMEQQSQETIQRLEHRNKKHKELLRKLNHNSNE